MKLKLKIQQKIQIFIISSTIIIYLIAVGYISLNARKMAYNDATELTNLHVQEAAKNIKAQLDADMMVVKTLTDAFYLYKEFPKDEWQDLVHKIYFNVFKNNPHIYGLWDSWELGFIDKNYDKPYGRICHTYWRENGSIKTSIEYRSMTGDPPLYTITKSILVPSVAEPYFDIVTVSKQQSYLMFSLRSPMIVNNQFAGVVAIDITLAEFQKIIESIKPFNGSYAFLLSYQSVIAGHYQTDLLNKKFEEVFPGDEKQFMVSEKIKKGESFNYISKDANGVPTYYSYAPILVKHTVNPWSIAVAVPVAEIMTKANRNFRISILVGIAGILVMIIVIYFIGRNITNPITKITGLLNLVAKGHVDEKMRINISSGDEIEEMAIALNKSIEGLNNKVDFANYIGKGELNQEFVLLSDEDVLGKSLIEMRNSLVRAKEEEEKRKIEDDKRRWSNEGLAKFADILRQNNDNLETLATEIIMNLVNYLNANQGGVFILNDEDKEHVILSMLSSFAFDRRKFLQKTIELGEGLVGTCAIEKRTIFMTSLPQDYIEVTSGLGGANPNCLLIVPLKLEETVLGVLEIASFNVFEKHEIEFVEKLAESIASTLSAVRINIRTTELLERSQQQAEEMAAQEEEVRQNMEELQATQEESARKGAEMEGLIEALNTSSYVIEYDIEGYIQNVNENYLSLIGLSKQEVLGTHHSGNMEFTEQQQDDYDKFWKDLRTGKVRKETTKVNIRGKQFVFAETYTPIRNSDGEIYKILKISNNITDFHKN